MPPDIGQNMHALRDFMIIVGHCLISYPSEQIDSAVPKLLVLLPSALKIDPIENSYFMECRPEQNIPLRDRVRPAPIPGSPTLFLRILHRTPPKNP